MKVTLIEDKWTYRYVAQHIADAKFGVSSSPVDLTKNERHFLELAINNPKDFVAKYCRPLSWDLDFLETDPNEVAQCSDSGAREIQRHAKKILQALAEHDLVMVTD